jgi:glycerol-3-phosphate dehydrogenase (NAD(P)+)
MPTKFAVLGDGAWGTAVALLLAQKPGRHVVLWSAREENGRLLQERRENLRLLPGVRIPESIELTMDIRRATEGAALWVMAVPTVYMRATLSGVAGELPPAPAVLSLAKGIEERTLLRPTEILAEILHAPRLAVLSGPSHAEETTRGMPTSVVVASTDRTLAGWIQEAFTTDRFRVYTNQDPLGVELGGALKNIIGIAAGISDGLGLGDNAKSALLTRGLVEMTRFGVALGARAETFMGLAGLGDMITTCISPHGRNRRLGERLARGERWADIRPTMTMVAEGAFTAHSVHDRAAQMAIAMPITAEVYCVLYEGKDPRAAVSDLMQRDLKQES